MTPEPRLRWRPMELDLESLSESSSSSVEPKPVTWTSTTAGETRLTRLSNEALIWRIRSTDLSVVIGFCAPELAFALCAFADGARIRSSEKKIDFGTRSNITQPFPDAGRREARLYPTLQFLDPLRKSNRGRAREAA